MDAKDFDPDIFITIRTMYNYYGTNHADNIGLVDGFRPVAHGSGVGHIARYTTENLKAMREVEEKLKSNIDVYVDAVQLGFELLNENNTGWKNGQTEGPHNSIEEMFNYYLMMRSVWGRKLMLCIGGSYGTNQPLWTRQINQAVCNHLAENGDSLGSWFMDSYGQETYETLFHFFFEILANAGLADPFIAWLEVTGGCNQWLSHPQVRKSPAQLFEEFLQNMYSFLHNMGCWPTYQGTDKFINRAMAYVPTQVKNYREWVAGADPGPVDPPEEFVTIEEFKKFEADTYDAWHRTNERVDVMAERQTNLRDHLRSTPE
jgi:hypothetical protein